MGAQQSLQRFQDRRTLEAAAEGRLDGVAISRDLFEARGVGLIALPAGLVARMADASTVDVSENRVEFFPAQMCTLAGLKTLVAHDNRIRELPRAFGDLFSLQALDISRNLLRGPLADSVASLKQLRELRLQQNKFERLPDEIGNLVHLRRLAMDHNSLERLPESFTKLTSLEELGLSYNALSTTHAHLDRLTRLVRLDLSFNRLREVPPLGDLTALRALALESNKLRMPLPPLCFRGLRSLTALSLGGQDNRILALPPTMTGDLATLTIPRSTIETRGAAEGAGAAAARVAERAAAAAAEAADVDDDTIIDPMFDPRVARVGAGAKVGGRVVTAHQVVTAAVAAGTSAKEDWDPIDKLRRAQQLSRQLSRQQKARMADDEDEEGEAGAGAGLGGRSRAGSTAAGSRAERAEDRVEEEEEDEAGDATMRQLQRLSVLALQKAGLRHLPDGFGSFRALTSLDLSQNRHLKTLPESLTRHTHALDTLILTGCALEALPTSLGRLSSLTCLHCQLNRLTVLPPSIGRLRQLTELDASGNPKLIDLPEQLAQGCVRLRTLRLGECSALRLPDNLGEAEELREVTVAARQVAVAASEVRELLESGRIRVMLT